MALKIQEWNPELGNYEVFHHYGTPDGQLMDGKDPSIPTGILNNIDIPLGGGENVYYIPNSSSETRENNFWTPGGATGGMDSIQQFLAQREAMATQGYNPATDPLPANMQQSADPLRALIEQRQGMYPPSPQQDAMGQLIQQRQGMYPAQQQQTNNSTGFSLDGTRNWLSNVWNSIRGPGDAAGVANSMASNTPGVAQVNSPTTGGLNSLDPMTAAAQGIAAQNGMKINPQTGQWDPMGWQDMSFNQKLNTGLSAAQDIWGLYSGFKGMSMAKKQMEQQQRQWDKTYQANAKAQNADSWLRSMNLNNGNAQAAQRAYDKDRLSEQG